MRAHHRHPVCARRAGVALLGALLLATGCATQSLPSARSAFYAGRMHEAADQLAKADVKGPDRVLLLMERGTVRQALGAYEESSKDFIRAYDEIQAMTALQVSKDTGSMVVNDNIQDYRGKPFERTLLHAFTAQNHLSVGHWENAAVEARRAIISLEPAQRRDYPEDAYSRYMAGFCLELIGDPSNASLQYRKAAELSPAVQIDDRTGRLAAGTNKVSAVWPVPAAGDKAELVCFVLLGRSPRGAEVMHKDWVSGRPMYAEVYAGDRKLGRSYTLSDTVNLAFTTAQKEAAAKAVKTIARVAVKEGIAYQIERDNELLGELVRFVLIGLLEQPDTRRWETLPRWLQVARVPCPPDLKDFTVVVRSSTGQEISRHQVSQPLQRNGRVYVSVFRDVTSR